MWIEDWIPLIEPERGCEEEEDPQCTDGRHLLQQRDFVQGSWASLVHRLPCAARPAVKVNESPSLHRSAAQQRGRQVPNRVYGTLPGSLAVLKAQVHDVSHDSFTQGVGTSMNRRNSKT